MTTAVSVDSSLFSRVFVEGIERWFCVKCGQEAYQFYTRQGPLRLYCDNCGNYWDEDKARK
jgi:hypothetical protein